MNEILTKPATPRSRHSNLKLAAAGVSILYAASGIYAKSFGDVFFGIIMAFMAFLDEYGFDTNRHVDAARQKLQRFYRQGDKIARILVFIIGVGGTALVLDGIFNLNVIPIDAVDPWIKRLAPALVIAATTLFVVTFFSKFFYQLNVTVADRTSNRIEVALYLTTSLFIVSNTVFWIGINVENMLPSSSIDPNRYDPGQWADISPWWQNFLLSLVLISLVWLIASFIWAFSRYAEHYWRDAPLNSKSKTAQNDISAKSK
ncbi:hypothetical protein ACFSQT_03290 [Mesorhizobium calcicola]|uniref:Uncharacterized protein n=1 Tax=Mesorhizobium calcicola TaxID=1300310 RepID=A0ABW4W6H1_9HYPH